MGGDPEGTDPTDAVAAILRMEIAARPQRPPGVRPYVVGIAGAVAVGKTTLAAELAGALPTPVEVIATDSFLLPNAELEARDLFLRKGFPESYDARRLDRALAELRDGRTVTIPVYSHETYDVVAGASRTIEPPEVLVLEGVNALRFTSRLDCGVYLDAPEDVVEGWYVSRFLELCASAGPGSFYAPWATLTADDAEDLAAKVWRAVNLVNLRDHIAPTRAAADLVVAKDAEHRLVHIEVLTRPETRGRSG